MRVNKDRWERRLNLGCFHTLLANKCVQLWVILESYKKVQVVSDTLKLSDKYFVWSILMILALTAVMGWGSAHRQSMWAMDDVTDCRRDSWLHVELKYCEFPAQPFLTKLLTCCRISNSLSYVTDCSTGGAAAGPQEINWMLFILPLKDNLLFVVNNFILPFQRWDGRYQFHLCMFSTSWPWISRGKLLV